MAFHSMVAVRGNKRGPRHTTLPSTEKFPDGNMHGFPAVQSAVEAVIETLLQPHNVWEIATVWLSNCVPKRKELKQILLANLNTKLVRLT